MIVAGMIVSVFVAVIAGITVAKTETVIANTVGEKMFGNLIHIPLLTHTAIISGKILISKNEMIAGRKETYMMSSLVSSETAASSKKV